MPGYKWENPDLIAVDYSVSKLLRSLQYSVTSFEVKLRVEPQSVWQAAHYLRFSHEGYLAIAKDEHEVSNRYEGRVFELAVELGLGVLCYDKNAQQFKEIQTPRAASPDQHRVQDTIVSFGDLFKQVIQDSRDGLFSA